MYIGESRHARLAVLLRWESTMLRLVLIAALVIGAPPRVLVAQCVTFDNPPELFAVSDAVFLGKVVETAPTGARGHHVIESIATFRLERSWKGPRDRVVRVGSETPLQIGRRYLVFATGRPLATSTECRWSEPIEQATEKLDWLSTIRHRNVR
jgi:hypothetical protein